MSSNGYLSLLVDAADGTIDVETWRAAYEKAETKTERSELHWYASLIALEKLTQQHIEVNANTTQITVNRRSITQLAIFIVVLSMVGITGYLVQSGTDIMKSLAIGIIATGFTGAFSFITGLAFGPKG